MTHHAVDAPERIRARLDAMNRVAHYDREARDLERLTALAASLQMTLPRLRDDLRARLDRADLVHFHAAIRHDLGVLERALGGGA